MPASANDVRAREETTSGAVVVLAKGDVTDRTGDDDFKKRGKDVSLTPVEVSSLEEEPVHIAPKFGRYALASPRRSGYLTNQFAKEKSK